MSYIYSQALAAAFSVGNCLDTDVFVPSKSMSIASKSFQRGKKTVVFHGFPSLQMFKNSTESRGAALLKWWQAGFLAKTLALQETAQVLADQPTEILCLGGPQIDHERHNA